jgi:hypothetical protein
LKHNKISKRGTKKRRKNEKEEKKLLRALKRKMVNHGRKNG